MKRLLAIDSTTSLHIWDISGGLFMDTFEELE